jgi:hypothetical protein
MNNYGCICTTQINQFIFIENIIIKTKSKINKKYKYFDDDKIIICYKINHIHTDLYELRLYKLINKLNNDIVIIPQDKNPNNITKYYNDICKLINTYKKPEYTILFEINTKDLFNNYYLFYDIMRLYDHSC